MKYLLLVTLFAPMALFAQKNEVSEQFGYMNTKSLFSRGERASGFSNQVAISRHFNHAVSGTVFYEYCQWQDKYPTINRNIPVVGHSFGIAADIHFSHFYIGPNAEIINVRVMKPESTRATLIMGRILVLGCMQAPCKKYGKACT